MRDKSEGHLRSLCQHLLSLLDSVKRALFVAADRTFSAYLEIRLDNIDQKAHSLVATETASLTFVPISPGHIGTSYNYKSEDLLECEGKVRMRPQFKKELQQCVTPGKTEKWQLMYLKKRTPDIIDLSNCVSVAEAWKRLDNKYANPIAVSTKVVDQLYKFRVTGTSGAS